MKMCNSCGLNKELTDFHRAARYPDGYFRKCKICVSWCNKKRNSLGWSIWNSMLGRCNNTKNQEYKNYGGRGIKVCRRWMKFKNFLEDMGIRPEGMTLDRIDNNRNYEPLNCRWSTQKEQNNNKRSNVILELNGEKMNVTQWAEKLELNSNTLFGRLWSGWPVEKALTTKTFSKYRRKDFFKKTN